MTSTKFTDMAINIKKPAWKVLQMLNRMRIPAAPKGIYDYAETSAWYNGRERGIVITFRRGWEQPTLAIVFAESRNSDSLMVSDWVKPGGFFNPPTTDDRDEKTYQASKYFHPDKLQEAAAYIHGLIQNHASKIKKAVAA